MATTTTKAELHNKEAEITQLYTRLYLAALHLDEHIEPVRV
jgi:hypothetical protein